MRKIRRIVSLFFLTTSPLVRGEEPKATAKEQLIVRLKRLKSESTNIDAVAKYVSGLSDEEAMKILSKSDHEIRATFNIADPENPPDAPPLIPPAKPKRIDGGV